VQAGWEIDLFGRIAREREASLARLDARTADWHEARVSVAAETAAQYLQFRYCEALVAIAQADAASRAETATVTDRAAAAGFQAPAAAALTRASAAEAAGRLTGQRAECDLTVKALVALTGLADPWLRFALPNKPCLPRLARSGAVFTASGLMVSLVVPTALAASGL
jgi:outer membrane protein TolC